MDAYASESDVLLDRLVVLSDGVFAIAITLLVLEIAVPAFAANASFALVESRLPGDLVNLLPQIATYALSFVIVTHFWLAHHRIFHYIERANVTLVWLNAAFLMSVAFLPVPSRILGEYGNHAAAVQFYVLSLAATGLCSLLMWRYASGRHRLVAADLDASIVRHQSVRFAIAPVVCALVFALSFASPYLAEASLAIGGLGITIHERFYARRARSASRAPAAIESAAATDETPS